MDAVGAAFIGLGGALVGAGATLVGAAYNAHKNEESSERERSQNAELWERGRKEDAYDRARHALLRLRNRRKRMRIRGYKALDKEIELQLFLQELVDAQHGLSTLLVACGEEQKETLAEAGLKFDALVDDLIRPPTKQKTCLDKAHAEVEKLLEIIGTAQDDDLQAGRRQRPLAIRSGRSDAAKHV